MSALSLFDFLNFYLGFFVQTVFKIQNCSIMSYLQLLLLKFNFLNIFYLELVALKMTESVTQRKKRSFGYKIKKFAG